jgi:hypothetical protein
MSYDQIFDPPDPDRGSGRVPDVSKYDTQIRQIIREFRHYQESKINALAKVISDEERMKLSEAKVGVESRMRQLKG